MYRERPSTIPGAVVWDSVADGRPVRVLPDGCMDLLWDGSTLSVAGADTVAKVYEGAPGRRMTGLRFRPGFAPQVLGVPASELVDERPPLDALWGRRASDRAVEMVASAADAGRSLERIAAARTVAAADELVDVVAALAAAGTPVATIAHEVGLSSRQLQRRSLDAFGYGAKTLGRVLRLQRALTLSREGVAPADAAAGAGYADQPHLAREVKALCGIPLGTLLA